jgi:hypothetical protein
MRILCVCHGGRVRSVALRHILIDQFGHDVLACGAAKQSTETMAMLCRWAEAILLLEPGYVEAVPPEFRHKSQVLDVGPDTWGDDVKTACTTLYAELTKALSKVAI